MKAIIFDFDGLIIDTESADYLSWQAVYAAYGVPFPLDLWLGEVGTVGVFDPVDYLAERASRPVDPAGVRAQFRQQDAATVAGLPIMPGVLDWLAQARQQGLALAIASSSPHEWVDGHLQRLGLHDRFDVIVCRDDVSGRAKPQPDVYQLALGKLGVAAAEALAVEDSRNGVLAARAAGLRVVAVPNPVTQHQDLSPATRHLPSLAALTLPALLAEISANKPASRSVRQPVSQEAETLLN